MFTSRLQFFFCVVLSLTVVLACKEKESPCNEKDIEAILKFSDDYVQKYGLIGLGEVCRFPKPLDSMFKELQSSPPEYTTLVVYKAIGDDISLFEQVCPGAAKILARIAEAAPEEKINILVDSCGLEKLGLATRDELLRLNVVRLQAVAMAYAWMKANEVKLARLLCRRILGLR